MHLRIKGDEWEPLRAATNMARTRFEETPGLTLIEDSLPLPGIDWEIDVDVAKAGRYGADVATVGAMVQLVTRGILLDTMRVDSSDEEIEIRLRLPEQQRVLSTLDTLKLRTDEGLVPLSNFVTRKPVPKLATISRIEQQRYYDVKADVELGLSQILIQDDTGDTRSLAIVKQVAEGQTASDQAITLPSGAMAEVKTLTGAASTNELRETLATGETQTVLINANERIAELTKWLETSPFASSIDWEWTGDQEEQAESGAFLMKAFA